MNIEPVAFFKSPLKEKFGIPRQAGLVSSLSGEVRFVAPYDAPEALRGLEEFDYCWLVWDGGPGPFLAVHGGLPQHGPTFSQPRNTPSHSCDQV